METMTLRSETITVQPTKLKLIDFGEGEDIKEVVHE